ADGGPGAAGPAGAWGARECEDDAAGEAAGAAVVEQHRLALVATAQPVPAEPDAYPGAARAKLLRQADRIAQAPRRRRELMAEEDQHVCERRAQGPRTRQARDVPVRYHPPAPIVTVGEPGQVIGGDRRRRVSQAERTADAGGDEVVIGRAGTPRQQHAEQAGAQVRVAPAAWRAHPRPRQVREQFLLAVAVPGVGALQQGVPEHPPGYARQTRHARREVDERDRPLLHRQPHAGGQEFLRRLVERDDALERHVGEYRRREDLRDRADLEQGPLSRRTATRG